MIVFIFFWSSEGCRVACGLVSTSWRAVPQVWHSPLFSKDRSGRGKSSKAPFSMPCVPPSSHSRSSVLSASRPAFCRCVCQSSSVVSFLSSSNQRQIRLLCVLLGGLFSPDQRCNFPLESSKSNDAVCRPGSSQSAQRSSHQEARLIDFVLADGHFFSIVPRNECRATADQIRLLRERNGFPVVATLQKIIEAALHPDELW